MLEIGFQLPPPRLNPTIHTLGAKRSTSRTSLSTLATDGTPAAGAGSSIDDVDALFSSAADATATGLVAALRRAAAATTTRGARRVHREEEDASGVDDDEASTAGLAVEESIVILG